MKSLRVHIVFTLVLTTISFAQQGWFWQNPLPQGNALFGIHFFSQSTAIAVGARARS